MKIKNVVPGIILILFSALPVAASAGMSLDITPAGVTVHIGDRDHRGYYWDGYDWRAPKWWREHHGRHLGEKGPRGYWNGNGWQPHPPAHRAQPPHHEPAHDRPLAQRNAHQQDRPAAEPHGNAQLTAARLDNGAPGHRPDFQPHG